MLLTKYFLMFFNINYSFFKILSKGKIYYKTYVETHLQKEYVNNEKKTINKYKLYMYRIKKMKLNKK